MFSAPKVIIRLKCKPFNPLQNDEAKNSIFSADVMQNLLQYETAGTVYKYESGYNEITAFSTKEEKTIDVFGNVKKWYNIFGD